MEDAKGKLETAMKYDAGKLDWVILPLGAVEDIIAVLKFGEGKYARGNFAAGNGLSYTRVINAMLRHIFAFSRGEDNDPETGLSHIAHAGAGILFLLHYIRNKHSYSNDDRADNILL